MWVITGPFDTTEKLENEQDALKYQKKRFFQTGKSYILGRKNADLNVLHQRISMKHGVFTVGEFSLSDVETPGTIPPIELHNVRPKTQTILRDGETIIVNPEAAFTLQDGDSIILASGVRATLQWQTVCCYAPPTRVQSSITPEACAALGVYLLGKPHPDITHHLTPVFALTPAITTALLSVQAFVKPEWLAEVIRLGNLPQDTEPGTGTALERLFVLPSETKFRPTFSPSLPASLRTFKTWDRNEEREGMFRGHRFICVGEKGREIAADMKEVITRGGAECELFSVEAGRQKWHRQLSKAKSKAGAKQLVLVAEDGLAGVIGEDVWQELVEEAQSLGYHFIPPTKILESVATVDLSLLTSKQSGAVEIRGSRRNSSPLPDFIPNTHPEEPSLPPESDVPTRRLRRRATPSTESRPTSPQREDAETTAPPTTKKLLRRRANPAQRAAIIGIDDPSIMDSDPPTPAPDDSQPAPDPEPAPAPAPKPAVGVTPGRSSRLKRRAGTTLATPISQLFGDGPGSHTAEDDEPPLKRFKTLFEESDPDRLLAQSQLGDTDTLPSGSGSGSGLGAAGDSSPFPPVQLPQSGSGSMTDSQSQTQTRARGRSGATARPALGVVPEEEEEEASAAPNAFGPQRGLKRKASGEAERDEVDKGDGAVAAGSAALAKRRARENVNAVKPTSQVRNASPNRAGSVLADGASKTLRKASGSGGGGGAAAGKPDMDADFLKAVASRKKGKRAEDGFDREFNNLRISKPDLERDEEEKEWNVLADFGDDGDLRGNFMVVVEMEVPTREENAWRRAARIRDAPRVEWEGRQDFKKFKKKAPSHHRAPVELTVSEDNDYGMGAGYWKGSQSQSQGEPLAFTQTQEAASRTKEPSGSKPPKARARPVVPVADSEEENIAPRPTRQRPPSRAASRQPSAPAPVPARAARSTRAKSKALFIESDDDDDGPVGGDDDFRLDPDDLKALEAEDVTEDFGAAMNDIKSEDEADELDPSPPFAAGTGDSSTLRSSRSHTQARAPPAASAPKKRGRAAPAAVVVDDDSDDGATFKGFAKKRASRR